MNARKGVLPKLWIVLQEGGQGLATIIYPNLLPFISKVPHDVTEPKLDFSRTFFTFIIQGYEQLFLITHLKNCFISVSGNSKEHRI